MCPAPFAVFFELYFALDELLVLARPIIGARALFTRQFYELVLGHKGAQYPIDTCRSILRAYLVQMPPRIRPAESV